MTTRRENAKENRPEVFAFRDDVWERYQTLRNQNEQQARLKVDLARGVANMDIKDV